MICTPNSTFFSHNKAAQAQRKSAGFSDLEGDQLVLLKMYEKWCAQSPNERENWAVSSGLQVSNLMDADDIRQQLADLMDE